MGKNSETPQWAIDAEAKFAPIWSLAQKFAGLEKRTEPTADDIRQAIVMLEHAEKYPI